MKRQIQTNAAAATRDGTQARSMYGCRRNEVLDLSVDTTVCSVESTNGAALRCVATGPQVASNSYGIQADIHFLNQVAGLSGNCARALSPFLRDILFTIMDVQTKI
jgi:hypothetical protein